MKVKRIASASGTLESLIFLEVEAGMFSSENSPFPTAFSKKSKKVTEIIYL
jgi:hypothetical protein